MKKFLSFVLVTIMFIGTMSLVACDYKIPKDLEASQGLKFDKVNGGYMVIGIGNCKDSEVIIPSYHNGKKVISIKSCAFENCLQITKIAIPNTVKEVGDKAFNGCSNLQEVYIDKGVGKLGAMLFWMSSVENIYFNGTTKDFKEISGGKNRNAWYYVGADYGYKEFYVYCTDAILIYNFKDGDDTPKIKEYDKVSKGLNYTLNPDGKSYSVSGIGTCKDTDLIIPSLFNGKPVTAIADMAFYNTVYTDPIYKFKSVYIPDSVTNIGEQAFWGCGYLEKITLPESLITIGNWAFSDCKALTKVTIPKSVTSIGTGVFNYCTSLTNINVDAGNSNYKSIGGNLYSKDGKTILQYAPGKTSTSFIIPNHVENIAMHAFSGCYRLENITIDSGVKYIGPIAIIGVNLYSSNYFIINYKGTVAKWKTITKGITEYGETWNHGFFAYGNRYIIQCTDGQINSNDMVTYK